LFICSQLHGKSLVEANKSFLEKNEGLTSAMGICLIWGSHSSSDAITFICRFLVASSSGCRNDICSGSREETWGNQDNWRFNKQRSTWVNSFQILLLQSASVCRSMVYLLSWWEQCSKLSLWLSSYIWTSDGVLGPVREWKLQDCVAVHRLLETVFIDLDAASSKLLLYIKIYLCPCVFSCAHSTLIRVFNKVQSSSSEAEVTVHDIILSAISLK